MISPNDIEDSIPPEMITGYGQVTAPVSPKNYNPFQLSKMFGDGYQIVVRADTATELLTYMKDIKPFIEELEKKLATKPENTFPAKPQGPSVAGGSCFKCGAPRILSPKTGKWYCSEKCWLK